ncbi:MAG: CoA transferase [Candidatus Dormibacteraeota bacterium]|uniref:CoA transferase n=1 Tax=Candidatus Amunia macphersoniae TaxID=3127014 RepID=A0A934NAD4_9BACT|nr:CoA transferase [Candidatus Dormibacteraeota bacterium]
MTGTLQAAPLDGIRVVALEQAVAGPLCTRHLGDLGADVIKIERPGGGDLARGYDSVVHGESAYFAWLNRAKRSVVLDLTAAPDFAALEGLLGTADVFVHNLGPSAVDRMGLAWETLHDRWPQLISCGISGYGTDGPGAHRKGFDLLIQGESALVSVTGNADAPAKVGISIADISSGMYAFSSILAALILRGRTGEGLRIDVAMLDCLAEWMTHPLYHRMYGGKEPPRTGLFHNSICPYGPYPVTDGKTVNVGVHTPGQWRAFCTRVLDRPDLIEDERYHTNERRVANRATLEPIIVERLRTVEASALLEMLEAADIPCGVVNDVAGLADHVQLSSRDRWFEVGSPSGPIKALVPPFNLSGVAHSTGGVPGLGQHTQEVLAELAAAQAAAAE